MRIVKIPNSFLENFDLTGTTVNAGRRSTEVPRFPHDPMARLAQENSVDVRQK
jgi:hypothetical protein